MQIILASAKIMNDRLKAVPDVALNVPRFQSEAENFARDMAQYPIEAIAEILGCSHQIAVQNKFRFNRFFEKGQKLPAVLAYHGQAVIENRIHKPEELCSFSYENFSYEPSLGEPDYPHFIKS